MKITVINRKPLDAVIKLVNTLKQKNGFKWKEIELILDYSLNDCYGQYFDEDNNKLYVNPDRCQATGEYSLFFICIHELSHLIDNHLKITNAYEKEFTEKSDRLLLTKYSNENIYEEIAEMVMLYITNPYLIKIISRKHWQFLKRFLKSPTACSCNTFLKYYKNYNITWKEYFKKHFNIYVKNNTIYFPS